MYNINADCLLVPRVCTENTEKPRGSKELKKSLQSRESENPGGMITDSRHAVKDVVDVVVDVVDDVVVVFTTLHWQNIFTNAHEA